MLKKGLPKEDGKVMFLIFTMLAKITWKREEVWNIFNDILCFVALPRCLPFCDIYTTIYGYSVLPNFIFTPKNNHPA